MKQRMIVFVLVMSVILACSIDPIFNEREITENPSIETTFPELPPQSLNEGSDPSGQILSEIPPVAFVATAWCVPGSGREILLMNPDGSGIVCITNMRGQDNDPNWSADGQKIVFVSDRSGGRDLFLMNPDGSEQQQISFTDANEFYPAFSPDGEYIVYASESSGIHKLETMELYTGDVSPVEFQNVKSYNCIYPEWSPDGEWLVFSCFGEDLKAGIYISHPDGSDLQLLQAGPLHHPVWSPDGKMIAFDGEPAGCKFEVYTMKADGSEMRQITEHPECCGGYNKHPAWSPDGDLLIFSSYRKYADTNGSELFSINLDGSGEKQLTFSYNEDLFNSPIDAVWNPVR